MNSSFKSCIELIFLATVATACTSHVDKTVEASTSFCSTFTNSSPGNVSLTISGSNATVDWQTDLSSVSDSVSVALSGPSSISPITGSKPAAFAGLPNGSWSTTVTYSKASCGTATATKTFTINTAVDCTAWNAQSISAVNVTNTGANSVSVNWTTTVTGQSSFSTTVTGPTNPSPVTNTKPSTFSGLALGSYSAQVSYSKAGCSDHTHSQSFVVPVSLATNIFPVLNSKCSSCHGGNGGFSIGGNSAALYSALTSPSNGSCSPAQANADRVDPVNDPANAANSFFYRKVATTDCGTEMASNGGLTAGEISLILNWISQGALNN